VLTRDTVLGDRFVVGELAGTGGMGAVHRAVDRESGKAVAIKVLGKQGELGLARFTEEARTLAAIDHPNVVRYVAHGLTKDGEAFLAMEWLDGEDLATRIARAALSIDDTLAVARGIAGALAAAHAREIVHRDVKPSNVFLVGGDVATPKLIDFGIALARRERLTQTGLSLGTLGYMAPEQASGRPDVGPAADIFALGSVLFECLSGTPAFDGSPVAVLAKILLHDPPLLRDVMPDAPRDLDELVERMLAKDPAQRPANGAIVEKALRTLSRSRPPPAQVSISAREQRVVSVVLGDRRDVSIGQTITPGDADAELTTARAIVLPFGGDVACTASGAIVVTLSGANSGSGTTAATTATDLAARAASIALALRDTLPHLDIALATGRAEVNRASPVGPAIDRAAALLPRTGPSALRIDDVAAGLLEGRFTTRREGDHHVLVGRADANMPRTLLGKATPCLGREKELALLLATFDECRTQSVSRSVLVTAPAGTGKSRLTREIVARISTKQDVLVLTARGDAVGAGFALGSIRQLLRAAFPSPSLLSLLARSRLRRVTDRRRAERLAAFLVELAGEDGADVTPELRAARNDPRLMREWQKLAFREWVTSECAQRPVVLVFEDLQWSDGASIAFVDDALRALEDRPLFVLALARPDCTAEMGTARGRQALTLAPLGKRICEEIARAALPASTPPDTIARIVERSEGNAFFLEELVRSVSEGRAEEAWPETVVAMVQMRLEAHDAASRRILRAASVFGEDFHLEGVAALLGEPDAQSFAAVIPTLVSHELVLPVRGEPGADAFRFRHALVRDAAYAMLTEDDRLRGHRLAAAWLETRGDVDPITLAEHWLSAKENERAIPWLVRAARAAIEGGDLDGALRLSSSAATLGASGEMLGAVRGIEGDVLNRRASFAEALVASKVAVELLPAGSVAWWRGVAAAAMSSANVGDAATIVDLIARVSMLQGELEPSGPLAFAITVLAAALVQGGQRALVVAMEERLAITAAKSEDPLFDGWRAIAGSIRAIYVDADPARGVRAVSDARARFHALHDPLGMGYVHMHLGVHLSEAGAYDQSEAAAEEAESAMRAVGVDALLPWIHLQRIRSRAYAGRLEGAADALAKVASETQGSIVLVARAFGTELALLEGRLDDAASQAELLLGFVPPGFLVHIAALETLARVSLARGEFERALDFAERALAQERTSTIVAHQASVLRLVRVRALLGLGRDAKDATAEAKARIQRLAAGFDDASLAGSFRTRVDVNAETLALD
jgi:tetratricopeptide (TPR) repeat protein